MKSNLLQIGRSLLKGRPTVPRIGLATLLHRPPTGGKTDEISLAEQSGTGSVQMSILRKSLLFIICRRIVRFIRKTFWAIPLFLSFQKLTENRLIIKFCK